MPKQSTFKISQKGVQPVTVTFNEPENIPVEAWKQYIPGGDVEAGINELAVQNLVIKMQAGGRRVIGDGQAAAQTAINEYKYGQRTAGTRMPAAKLSAESVKKGKFSAEQLAMLKAAGVNIEGMEEEKAPLAKAG